MLDYYCAIWHIIFPYTSLSAVWNPPRRIFHFYALLGDVETAENDSEKQKEPEMISSLWDTSPFRGNQIRIHSYYITEAEFCQWQIEKISARNYRQTVFRTLNDKLRAHKLPPPCLKEGERGGGYRFADTKLLGYRQNPYERVRLPVRTRRKTKTL